MRLMCRSQAFEDSDLRAPKMTPEPFGGCKSEVGADFLDSLGDFGVVGGFEVEA